MRNNKNKHSGGVSCNACSAFMALGLDLKHLGQNIQTFWLFQETSDLYFLQFFSIENFLSKTIFAH